jgi:hypothetical protein
MTPKSWERRRLAGFASRINSAAILSPCRRDAQCHLLFAFEARRADPLIGPTVRSGLELGAIRAPKARHISKTFHPIFHSVPPVPGSIPVLPATPASRPGLFTIGPSGLFIISPKNRQKPSVSPVRYSEASRPGLPSNSSQNFLFCKLLLKLVTTPFLGWWAAINGRSFEPKSSFCKKVNGIGRLAGFASRINSAAILSPCRRDAGAPRAASASDKIHCGIHESLLYSTNS